MEHQASVIPGKTLVPTQNSPNTALGSRDVPTHLSPDGAPRVGNTGDVPTQHSPDGAPGVGVGLGAHHRLFVGLERLVHLADAGVAPPQQVKRARRLGRELERPLQVEDGLLLSAGLLSERLDTVEEPAELPVQVVLQRGREVLLLQERLVPLPGGPGPTHHLVQVRYVKQD